MVSLNTAYSTTSYASLASSIAAGIASSAKAAAPTADTATAATDSAATSITLSDAAKAALEQKPLATVVAEARTKLTALLTAAKRSSPLQGDKLALDLSSLDQRELYAITSSTSADAFSGDEKKAASLEMQRRFDAALAGPAAIAKVTGSYSGLYKAAADYLDGLGPEERADPKTVAARNALTTAMKQLVADPKTLPTAGDDDPVALYLQLAQAGKTTGPRAIGDVASDMRTALDQKYAAATASGRAPTFNKNTKVGAFIDLSGFDARSLSAMVLNSDDKFSPEEANAANAVLRSKGSAALIAGYKDAAKSQDPTALSQNLIGIYSSMSQEERQALGWSEKFYQAALQSYASTTKLTQMFADAGADTSGFMSWMGK